MYEKFEIFFFEKVCEFCLFVIKIVLIVINIIIVVSLNFMFIFIYNIFFYNFLVDYV